MGYYSPLAVGQIIYPSQTAQNDVWDYVRLNNKENLAKGLLCEYAHNDAFTLFGWDFATFHTTHVYDRYSKGLMQDDKLATIDNGYLCPTHTISQSELHSWSRSLHDVIIHSFEEQKDGGSRYCGAISFHRFLAKGVIVPSQKYGNYFFNRKIALEIAGL